MDLCTQSEPKPKRPWRVAKVERECEQCGTKKLFRPCDIKRGRGRYCSYRCTAIAKLAGQDMSGANNPNWKTADNSRNRSRRSYYERHPAIYAAHRATKKAILLGDITRQSCEVCGDGRSNAHHDDYSKPLDVRWLCRKHHDEHHRKHGRAPEP